MYVCLCKGITDSQIRAAIEDGASSVREVRNSLGVASQCGKCGVLTRVRYDCELIVLRFILNLKNQ